jgi:hypothetical protein
LFDLGIGSFFNFSIRHGLLFFMLYDVLIIFIHMIYFLVCTRKWNVNIIHCHTC